MIHGLSLPKRTQRKLSLIVMVQMAFLRYAATQANRPRKCCTTVCQVCCGPVLTAMFGDVQGLRRRGQRIANWVFNAQARCSPLHLFAQKVPGTTEAEAWLNRLQGDIDMLGAVRKRLDRSHQLYNFDLPKGKVADAAKTWKHHAADFLKVFYTDFSNGGLSADVLRVRYGRQDFLQAFRRANKQQWICAMCDEAPYGTHDAGGQIRTEIDHYFPKFYYPHLAMHPYNLVPVCHICNGPIKGDTDPMKAGNDIRTLAMIALPYRDRALRSDTYVKFNDTAAGERMSIQVRYRSSATRKLPVALTPAESLQERAARLVIEERELIASRATALGDVYRVPKRWNARPSYVRRSFDDVKSSNTVEEALYRRALSYLRAGDLSGQITPLAMLDRLEALIGYVHRHDMGIVPDSYAFSWWLAAQARELEQLIAKGHGGGSAFMATVNRSYNRNPEHSRELRLRGRKLRGHVEQ